MLINKAFRFRVYPTVEQISRLAAWDNALRFLWNIANEQRRAGYARPKDERRFPTAFDQMKELTELRSALPWLADVPRNVCAQLLAELDLAWKRCFKHISRAPCWKRKGVDLLGFTEPHPKIWRINSNSIRFPKLGVLRTVIHRSLDGKPKTCTLKREGDQWFASIVCEMEVTESLICVKPTVALDRGVINIVADSDGHIIHNSRHLDKISKQLAHAQRVVFRRKKGSKNREKAKLRVARLHRKVRRQRVHVLHEISNAYAKSHGTVIVEKLAVQNMTRSSKGNVENPGRNVRQKAGLNRSILDAGWGILIEQLRYKLTWSGGRLIEVSAAYSSQTCAACGHVDAGSRLSQSIFCCTGCNHKDHADINAAKVLLTRANRSGLPVEGDSALGSRKRVRLRATRYHLENTSL